MAIKKLTRIVTSRPRHPFARRVVFYGCLLPLFNAASALALGLLVVYSDADRHKVLTGFLSACNVGGWAWWLAGSFRVLGGAGGRWDGAAHTPHSQRPHPGFRLAGLLSAGGALSWVGVLCLLAYGMLG
jgi:hypothetical protein